MERKNETKKQLNELITLYNNTDFTNDKQIVDLINNVKESDIYTGISSDGEDLVLEVIKGKSISISFYQDNGFINRMIYTLDGANIIKENIYEPSGN